MTSSAAEVGGFRLGERLHTGRNAVVFRAVRPTDGRRAVIKLPAADYPSQNVLDRFRSEYEILRRLDDPRIVRPIDLVQHGNSLALVLEPAPGLRLRDFLGGRRLPLTDFLRIASGLAGALAAVHAKDVLHKDVNPGNVVVDPDTLAVRLVGFHLAAALPRESADAGGARDLEGTLAYVSPEQTGRMNRSVDQRSDLYSLGVTCYEMLTGRPPFVSSDPAELVHSHIARPPAPPRELRPDLPETISRIVMRLLAKTPEQRYQGAAGLAADLKTCLASAEKGLPIPDFEPGREDFPARFHVPERLYGRAADVARLLGAFDAAAQARVVLALVRGYSGVGKSSVVAEVHKPIVGRRGHFAAGKFNQFSRDVPYAPLYAALRSLVREILAASDAEVAEWRRRFAGALGPNGRLITDVVPELTAVLGEQPAVPELPPRESKNRFQRTFRDFLALFTRPEHPIALFLDDLQWVDSATLEWIEATVADRGLGALLLIGAYRDNEVPGSHPLARALERIRAAGARVEEIELLPLGQDDVAELVADTLQSPRPAGDDLARLVHERTRGNPFFVIQVLETLHREGAISRDPSGRRWTHDIDAARRAAISDDVVELMVSRLARLPADVRGVLQIAAIVGNRFDLRVLLLVTGVARAALRGRLHRAVLAGLLLNAGVSSDGENEEYRFLHDRVQQAAAGLMDEDETRRAHLSIGRLLRDSIEHLEDDNRLFGVLRHLNASSALLDGAEERARLAQLNLAAAGRARRSAAYEPALAFAAHAEELVASPTFETTLERAWCEHLAGRPDEADRRFARAVELAGDDASLAHAYESRIHVYADQGKFPQAYAAAREGAARFGVRIPAGFVPPLLVRDLVRSRLRQGKRPIASLVDLPEMTDERMKQGCRIVAAALKAAYQIRPELCVANSATIAALTLRHGNFDDNPIAFLAVGCIFVGAILRRHRAGLAWGQVVLTLCERPRALRFKSEVNFVYGYFVNSWSRPYADTETYYRAAWQAGVDMGDYFHAGCASSGIVQNMFQRGAPLEAVWKEAESLLEFCRRIGATENEGTLRALRQAVRSLRGQTRGRASFDDDGFDEIRFVGEIAGYGSPHFAHFYYAAKIQVLCLWDEPEAAVRLSAASRKFLKASAGMQHSVDHEFYEALCHAELLSRGKGGTLGRLARAARRFRGWAKDCPENFRHRGLLLAAELARATGDVERALPLYDEAIEAASKHGFVQHAALACERAGRLYLSLRRDRSARYFLREAVYAYRQWGATAIADALVERHAILADAALSGSAESVAASPRRGSTTSSTSGSASMDVATVTKAAQAISGEVRLKELLSSLLSIVMENAGASRGVLLLPGSSELIVQAERRVGDATAELLQAVPLSRHDRLARSVIQYVARTRESVVLADAAASQFASDPYVAAAKPRSLLAAPLLHQGRLAGVVYLENDLATGAFTAERVELLTVLSGQIAVSINNAELYGRLEEKVAERTQQLEVRNRFIQHVFGRYLTEDVVESLLGTPQGLHMGGEKRVVTVMMSDLRGFTSLAEGLTPESVVLMLNNYLGAMTDVIVRHQGTIDEFLGDAILVVFGAPFLHDDDALRAVRCAVAMQVAMSEVNAFNRSRGLPEVEMGIGIHTGEVVVGNIGSQKRAKYGVVGATVNLASRIESYTLGGDVLVSAETLAAAGASVRVIDEMLVEPKGVREPITVHYVGGVEGGEDALLLPRAAAPLEALAAPLDATVTVVRGKDATGGAVAARLVRASAFEGEFLCGAPIEPLSNVRLRFPSLEGELSRADAYAKILRRPVERGFAVRFTSLPHDLRGALSARPAT